MNQEIIKAIKNQNIIKFSYEGELRIVEPHCYGETVARNEGLRAYQVDGYSSSGKMGWKMYDLGKADDIVVMINTFEVRNGYNKGDKGMSIIYVEI